MSEHATPEERTEMPTDRRMEQLRKDGQVHQSMDVVQAASLASGFMVLSVIWSWLVEDIKYIIVKSFTMIQSSETLTQQDIYDGTMALVYMLAPDMLIISGVVAAVASVSLMLQTNWNVKEKKVEVQFSMLNPINGIKRMFSWKGITDALKAIAKLCFILPIGYFGLKSFAPEMVMLIHMTVEEVMRFTGEACAILFWRIMYVLIVLAIIDFFWTKYQWLKQNKMTKQEVKDERKSVEGDESTKRKMQSKGLQRIAQRIRDSVPQADVVVTNPTHFSVALKYDRDSMGAPKVVAKGKGFLALKIREIAREAGVPVIERKPLARALYHSVEVGAEIPRELFKATARLLAYVYRLKNPHRNRARQQEEVTHG